MNRMQLQVKKFFEAVGQEIGKEPKLRDTNLRVLLIEEEAKELRKSIEEQDLIAAIDGLCDLLYVTIGAAIAWGIDIEPFFDEVHACNMKKVGGPRDPETGKQLKPADWVPPDHDPILKFMTSCYETLNTNGRVFDISNLENYWALYRVHRMIGNIDLDVLAQVVRTEWSEYAKETLGDKAPAGFTKPWDETGEWGREGNRRVAKAVLQAVTGHLTIFEIGAEQVELLPRDPALVLERLGGSNAGSEAQQEG